MRLSGSRVCLTRSDPCYVASGLSVMVCIPGCCFSLSDRSRAAPSSVSCPSWVLFMVAPWVRLCRSVSYHVFRLLCVVLLPSLPFVFLLCSPLFISFLSSLSFFASCCLTQDVFHSRTQSPFINSTFQPLTGQLPRFPNWHTLLK